MFYFLRLDDWTKVEQTDKFLVELYTSWVDPEFADHPYYLMYLVCVCVCVLYFNSSTNLFCSELETAFGTNSCTSLLCLHSSALHDSL